MAELSTLTVNSTTYDIKDSVSRERGIEFIRGTWTEASGTWTGVTEDPELYDGKQIILYMPFNGSGNATLNLTLAGGGTTGAKNVYFENTSRFTTHKGQNSQLHLIYHKALKLSNGTTYEGWWYVANRDTTINYQMRNSNAVKSLEAIPQYHLAGGTDDGYVKIESGAVFDVSYPLLVTQGAWTANKTYTNGFFEYQDQNIRNMIEALGDSYTGLTAYKMVYLVGTLNGVNFTVDSSLVTCTPPTSDNGKAYIPLGLAYSTYQLYFYSQRNVYGFRNGKFQELSTHADTAGTITGTLGLDHGGTGATSASAARTNLGLGSAATHTAATSVGNNSNLPTGAAVQSYVTGLGYTKNTGTVTKVTAGAGLTGGDITTTGTIALDESGVTAGSAGPTAAVTGNEGTTVAIPRMTVDKYGRVTALSSYNLTNKNTTYSAATTSANGLMSSTDKTKLNNTNVFYGTCATAAGTAAKVIELTNGGNFELKAGAVIGVKFTYTNSASDVTLNVEGTGAKQIWYDRAVYEGSSSTYCGYAGRTFFYMYDGTYWVWMHPGVNFNDNTVPSAYCSTGAGTAAKVASCSNYQLLSNSYIHVVFTKTNSVAGAITLNINSEGAKPIWINGAASSSSNHTLPAGSYIAYYDGSHYQFRTDGVIPGTSLEAVNDSDGNPINTTYVKNSHVVNALTTTEAGYVLDARQGTELQLIAASRTSYDDFITRTLSAGSQTAAGTSVTNVTYHGLQYDGYIPLGIIGFNTANAAVYILTMPDVQGLSSDSFAIAYGNRQSNSVSFSPTVDVLYIKQKDPSSVAEIIPIEIGVASLDSWIYGATLTVNEEFTIPSDEWKEVVLDFRPFTAVIGAHSKSMHIVNIPESIDQQTTKTYTISNWTGTTTSYTCEIEKSGNTFRVTKMAFGTSFNQNSGYGDVFLYYRL